MTLLINQHEFPFMIPADDPEYDYTCGYEVDLRGRIYECCNESGHDGSCWTILNGILVAIWDKRWDDRGVSSATRHMRVNGMDVEVDPYIPRSVVDGDRFCPDEAEDLPASKSYGSGTEWCCTVHIDDVHIATSGQRWLGIYTEQYYASLTEDEEEEVVFDFTALQMNTM